MSKFKIGDKVRSLVGSSDITTHDIYELIGVRDLTVVFKDNAGDLRMRGFNSVELVEENERPFNEGDKVFCKDYFEEFTGWLASIDDSRPPHQYSVVENREDIGKSFGELYDLYGYDSSVFKVFMLEHLTLLQDDPCQYCNLTKRELKIVQSELNDAYAMLQNRDDKIKELEEEVK